MSQMQKVGKAYTSIFDQDGETVVRYHDTEVVRFSPNRIVLNSGGYKTVMTKTRMNQTSNQFDLNYSVFQSKKEWFVSVSGRNIPFTNGMVISR